MPALALAELPASERPDEIWIVSDKDGDCPEILRDRGIAEMSAKIREHRWPNIGPHRVRHYVEQP